MEIENHETPQKINTTMQQSMQQRQRLSGGNGGNEKTPKGKSNRKVLHPRTPNASASTTTSGSSSTVHMFPTSVVNTPPAKRFQRIRNPFEPALADRLHLPLIGSPSLFQRPTTPQMSSTQFEWTIEDVSSLKPANVEPHETQFHDSPDPDYEAKAQSAISSYFKEQQIVPSPVDCPLRKHRIILQEMNGNTPISKPGRRIRDCGTQTELTLPSILPKELEDALLPYFQPHIAFERDYDDQSEFKDQLEHQRSSNGSSSSVDTKDISLRRKLFDMHNVILIDESKTPTGHRNQPHPPVIKVTYAAAATCSNSNSSPLSLRSWPRTAIMGKLSDSLDKSSFGSLSPISASDGMYISPESPTQAGNDNGCVKVESRMHTFFRDLIEVEQLSPIHPPPQRNHSSRPQKTLRNSVNAVISRENYRSQMNNSEHTIDDISAGEAAGASGGAGNSSGGELKNDKFTPERSSSPLHCCVETGGIATDSFNVKVSRLIVNSSAIKSGTSTSKCNKTATAAASADVEHFIFDDTDDILDVDEEDMQMSQLSALSSNCSSSNSDTPRSKRRSASRKNLSHSFSLNWLENEEEEENASKKSIPNLENFIIKEKPSALAPTANVAVASNNKHSVDQRLPFYRTDSGFNEMTINSNSSSQQPMHHHSNEHSCEAAAVETISVVEEEDVSMVCCSSTPSKQVQSFGISTNF